MVDCGNGDSDAIIAGIYGNHVEIRLSYVGITTLLLSRVSASQAFFFIAMQTNSCAVMIYDETKYNMLLV